MRHQKKRWFAALLALCMLLSILPSTSLAFSESEETWSGNRRNQTIDGGTHTITLSNLTIDSPGVEKSAIDITGNADVTFILEGNNTLRGYRNHPAIWVESGSSVTFEGNGLLEASAGGASIGLGAAGIGGGYGASSNFGNITINGGTIIARGSGGGAGIGGGYEVGSGTVTGNVTINGGYVTAIGGSSGSTAATVLSVQATTEPSPPARAETPSSWPRTALGTPPASLTGTVFLSAMRAIIRARRWVRTVRFT